MLWVFRPTADPINVRLELMIEETELQHPVEDSIVKRLCWVKCKFKGALDPKWKVV